MNFAGLYRIQSIYNITYEDFTKGKLLESLPVSPHKLGWADCIHMAETAKMLNDLPKQVEWIQAALKLASRLNDVNLLENIKSWLKEAITLHDKIALKHGRLTDLNSQTPPIITRIDPFNDKLAERNKATVKKWHKKHKKFLKMFPMFKNEPNMSIQEQYVNYNDVAYLEKIEDQCQNLPNSKYVFYNSTLKCENLHRFQPHLRLGPVKLETLSEYPVVAMFHDFFSEKECEDLKGKGTNRMKATPLSLPESRFTSSFSFSN